MMNEIHSLAQSYIYVRTHSRHSQPRGKKSELRGCSFRWVIFWINFSEHLETFFQTTLVFTSFRVFFLRTSKKMSWGKLNLQRFSIIINAPSTMTWTPSQFSTTTLLPCKLWPSTWVLHVCFRLHAALRSQFSQTNFARRMHDESERIQSQIAFMSHALSRETHERVRARMRSFAADKVDDLPQKFKQNSFFSCPSLVAQEKEKIGSTWKINIADNARTKRRCNKVMMTSVQTANWSLFFFFLLTISQLGWAMNV